EGWYNTHRRHSSLGYLSPQEFERRFTQIHTRRASAASCGQTALLRNSVNYRSKRRNRQKPQTQDYPWKRGHPNPFTVIYRTSSRRAGAVRAFSQRLTSHLNSFSSIGSASNFFSRAFSTLSDFRRFALGTLPSHRTCCAKPYLRASFFTLARRNAGTPSYSTGEPRKMLHRGLH